MGTDEIFIDIPDTVDDRYATFSFISWWEQQRVREATVLVVGAGALGNEVLKALALMGIGHLMIIDFDEVEVGNLSRSVLYRAADAGQPKAQVAARAIKELNPDVKVHWQHGDVNYELGLGVFRHVDVIIGCLDNREARLGINRACGNLGKPWVDGAIESLLGIARVFWPGREGACYECILTSRDHEIIAMRRSCGMLARENLIQGKVPTTPTAAAIIGSIQVQEALKLLHGMEVQPGVNIVFNGLTNESYRTRLAIRKNCMSHHSLSEIVELEQARADTTTAAELLRLAREHLNDETARLMLSQDVLVAWECPRCGATEPTLQPLYITTERQAVCPACGELRNRQTVSEIDQPTLPVAQHTLATLGVPPLDILNIYSQGRFVGFELTGDLPTVFSFE